MKWWKECPWYVWALSFLAVLGISAAVHWRTMRRPFSEIRLYFIGEYILDVFLLMILPTFLSILAFHALRLQFPIGWVIGGLFYLTGIYPAVRMWRWWKTHF